MNLPLLAHIRYCLNLLQAEVFAAVPGIDGWDLGFGALAAAAGVLPPADVVLIEHREGGRRVRDGIIGTCDLVSKQPVETAIMAGASTPG